MNSDLWGSDRYANDEDDLDRSDVTFLNSDRLNYFLSFFISFFLSSYAFSCIFSSSFEDRNDRRYEYYSDKIKMYRNDPCPISDPLTDYRAITYFIWDFVRSFTLISNFFYRPFLIL